SPPSSRGGAWASGADPEAGVTGSRLRLMPSRGRGSIDRMAPTARPWASSRWWTARTARAGARSPGGGREEARARGLVEGGPVGSPVRQGGIDGGGVVDEPVDDLAAGPAAAVL